MKPQSTQEEFDGWTQEQKDRYYELLNLSSFELVGECHKKFGFPVSDNSSQLPSTEILLFRLRFIHEEVGELIKAIEQRDTVEIADALADIKYVVEGTAHFCNFPFDEIYAEVHRSNMLKEKATKENPSKRGMGQYDLIKPVFWTKPDIAGVLAKHQPEVED
jgi:predicted HAD superfamily Cof-like phosphohydrolase